MKPINRRGFIHLSSFGLTSFTLPGFINKSVLINKKPIVVSTWDAGLNANLAAWKVLSTGGTALDAVEQGVMVTENEINCCVGLGANPDRDGHVTLDASIMDHQFNCGSVAFLERIKHPISVARRVMEKTPHVMLVGSGAQQFAISEGFSLEKDELSKDAKNAYENWLKKSTYKPIYNVERQSEIPKNDAAYNAPHKLSNGEWNHDTIGMIALDAQGNLSGSCTTSGAGFKMRGRLGDSPIIGAGLYVDNEIGAATATGLGEAVVRTCGSFLVVELMRQGMDPQRACESAVERIRSKHTNVKDFQVGFLAVNKAGEIGAFSVQPGFTYALHKNGINQIFNAPSMFK